MNEFAQQAAAENLRDRDLRAQENDLEGGHGSGLGGHPSGRNAAQAANKIYSFPLNLEAHEYGHMVTFFLMVDLSDKSSHLPNYGNIRVEGNLFGEGAIRDQATSGNLSSTNRAAGLVSVLDGIHGREWRPRIVRSNISISMFIPDGIQTTYEHTYNNDSSPGGLITTGALSGALPAAARKIADAYGSGADTGADAVGDGRSLTNRILSAIAAGKGSTAGQAALLTGASVMGGISDVGAIFKGILRKAFNPRIEFLYTATAPRTFQYTFKMIPRNVKEAEEIVKITKAFKIHSAPAVSSDGNILSFPNQFEIEYSSYSRKNTYLNSISTCVLNSMGVDYNTEGSMQFMRADKNGASPMTTTITLNFTETELMTANRIQSEGF